ncbi:MAG: Tfp pilus assembly protein FimT/FimU, partial [Gemmatimonas sp.]
MPCRLTAYPPPSFTRRPGLTLIAVVVVRAILRLAGALVVSRQVQRTGSQRVESADDLHVVVDSARRLAVQRQQVVRLRIYADGLWSV